MKSLLKKIAATAMALTLLGTGTVISKTSSKPDNTITTHAAFAHNCSQYRQFQSAGPWRFVEEYISSTPIVCICKKYVRGVHYTCAVCGKDAGNDVQYKVDRETVMLSR